MTIDTNAIVTATEANQNFSRVAKLAEKKGRVVVFKNNRPKLLVIDLDTEPQIEMSEDEKIRFFCEDISISEELPQNEREASKKNKILFAFGCFVIAFFISFGVHVLMDYFLWETFDVLSELVDAAFNGSIFTFLAYCGKFKKKADNSSGFTPKAQ